MPRASIVIPAHNESKLIGRCLSRIFDGAGEGEWEVVVVCNGCSDDTAERARQFSGVHVVELEQGDKMKALDRGDDEAVAFPRIYLDADAVVSADALRALADELSDPGTVRVGSPALTVDRRASTRLVQVYFDVWTRLRYASEAIGSGVYGVSAAARTRFDRFPERGGDDQLVYRLFTRDERVVSQPPFTYVAPQSLGALARSRARMFALNIELERTVDLPDDEGLGWRAQGLEGLVADRPRRTLRVLWFVAVQVGIRLYARQLSRRDSIPWNQDRTTRD